MESPKFKLVVWVEDYIDSVEEFDSWTERRAYDRGFSRCASLYRGDGAGCFPVEDIEAGEAPEALIEAWRAHEKKKNT